MGALGEQSPGATRPEPGEFSMVFPEPEQDVAFTALVVSGATECDSQRIAGQANPEDLVSRKMLLSLEHR